MGILYEQTAWSGNSASNQAVIYSLVAHTGFKVARVNKFFSFDMLFNCDYYSTIIEANIYFGRVKV